VSVLGASADAPAALSKFRLKQKLNFPLLSDPDHTMIESYGMWQKKKFMGRSYLGIVRATFLIDATGKIEKIWDHVKVKDHVAEVLAAASL
jgi:peroxiredoxin Q/BCP